MDSTTINNWLGLQCKMIPHVVEAQLLLAYKESEPKPPPIHWPTANAKQNPELSAAAELAQLRDAPVISEQSAVNHTPGEHNLIIAYPLTLPQGPFGTLTLRIQAAPNQQRILLQLLAWGAAWLELLEATPGQSQPASLAAELLPTLLSDAPAAACATSVASTLALTLDCQRVTIGLLEPQGITLIGHSQGVQFDRRTRLIRQIEAAMAEALHQPPIHYHPQAHLAQRPAHAALAAQGDNHWIYSIPLLDGEHPIGVLTLETTADQPLEKSQLHSADEAARLLGPALRMKQQLSQSPLQRLIQQPLQRLFGPRHLLAKSLLLGLTGVVIITSLITSDLRINATANIEGRVQRAIVAPFDGYITAVHRRSGESVKSGELLAELDDSQLRLEQRRWQSQQQEYAKRYRKALAALDHTEARIADAQSAQAQAQLALLTEQLQRTQLQAPFTGVIIEGDLSQSLGSPVERGEVLFQLAPLDEYRVALQVDERDIPYLEAGQQGSLRLASLPNQPIPITVKQIAAISSNQAAHAITFRVEAQLNSQAQHSRLRPGMQGIGKISVGEASLLWSASRRLIGWLQLHLWAWLP